MKTRIVQTTVVTAEETFLADVVIEGETIAAIDRATGDAVGGRVGASTGGEDRVDGRGLLLLPGGIDVHTHLDMPLDDEVRSADDFLSGTVAAAVGGTTTVIDYATQSPGGTLAAALATWQQRAAGRAVIDYGFHMIVCDPRADLERELAALVDAGVPSFKLFTAYPGRLMLDDGAVFRVLQATRDNGGLVCVHAENGHVIAALVAQALAAGHTAPRWHALTRPPRAEAEATHRVIALAEIAGAPVYVVHVSSAAALREIELARARGAAVWAETCPQYLFLSAERYDEPDFAGARYVMSPPLRDVANQAPLWRGLAERTLDTVATDHCPFRLADKARGRHDFSKIPNGGPGIEHRLTLLWQGVRRGVLSPERFVELTATAPARLFGLVRKGRIEVGADADLVLWDPHRRATISAATHHMRVDYDPYEGIEVIGGPRRVWSRGRTLVEEGTFVGREGAGRFVPRAGRSARGVG
jgi:dihydropyrimidinase